MRPSLLPTAEQVQLANVVPGINGGNTSLPTREMIVNSENGKGNLFPTNPFQSSTPYSATNEDPEKFPFPLKSNADNEKLRALYQSGWDQFGNFLMQSTLGEVIGGTIGGIGTVAELPIAMIDELTGGDADFNNSLIELGNKITEFSKDQFPIHRVNPNEAWDVKDSAWWWSNAVSVASTLSLMIPGWGVTKGLGALGEAMGITQKLTQGARAVGKQAAMAITMRNAENFKESLQTVESIYNDAYDKFSNMTDEQFERYKQESGDPEYQGKSRTDLANHIAAKAGWTNYTIDWSNIIFDFYQVAGMYKAAKALSVADDTARVLEAQALSMGNELSRAKRIWTNVKNAGHLVGGALSEGVEEAVNAIAQNEGMYYGQYLIGNKEDSNLSDRLSDYIKDPSTWEQAFWGVVGGAAFEGATKGVSKIKETVYKYQDPYSNQARIAQIEARKMQSEILGKELKDIVDGFVPNTERKTSFTGTQEEIKQQKEDALSKAISRNIESMTISGMQHGNQKLTKEFLNSEYFKQFLKENGVSSEEDYSKVINEINETANLTERQYNYYTKDIFGSLNTNESVKRIMAGRAVGWDRFKHQAEKKNSKITTKINQLMSNDAGYNNEEYTKHSPYYSDLQEYEITRQAVQILEKEANEFADSNSGKIAKQKVQDKIKELKEKRDKAAERISEYEKNNPDADLSKTPASWNKVTDLMTEQVLNQLAIDQVISIQQNDLKQAKDEAINIENELKKAHQEKSDKDYNAYRNVIDNTTDLFELEKQLEALENGTFNIQGRKQSDVKSDTIKKVRTFLEKKIEGIKELQAIKEQQKKANPASGVAPQNISEIENLRPKALPSLPTDIDITNTEDYRGPSGILDLIENFKNVSIPDTNTILLEQQVTFLEEYMSQLKDVNSLFYPTSGEAVDLRAREVLINVVDKFLTDLKIELFKRKNTTTSTNPGNLTNNPAEISPDASAKVNASITSFLANTIGYKAIDFNAHTSIVFNLFKDITEAFGVNEGEELSFERLLAYIYSQPLLGEYVLFRNYGELLNAYMMASEINTPKGKLFTIPKNENPLEITPNYIKSKYSGANDTDVIDSNRQIVEEVDNGIQIYLHPLTYLEKDKNDVDLLSPDKTISDSVKAIDAINVGDNVYLEVDKENSSYEENKENHLSIPIKITNENGILLGYVNNLYQDGDVVYTTHGGVRYELSNNGKGEINSMISYIFDNFEELENIYEDLQKIRTENPDFNNYERMVQFITNAINVNRKGDKINVDSKEYSAALNHFLNVVLFNINTNGTTKFNKIEIEKSLIRWHDILIRDMSNSLSIRNQFKGKESNKITQQVLSKSTGSISFAFDKAGNPIFRNVDEIVKKEDVVLAHTGNLPGFNLFTIDDTNLSDIGYLTDNRESVYNGLYMLIPSAKRSMVDGKMKTLYIPVKLLNNTIGGDNYDISEEQQDFNNKLGQHISNQIDMIFARLNNNVKDFSDIEEELRKYIIVDRTHFKIYAGETSKEIVFKMYDENNKAIDVKIIQREQSRTIKIGKNSVNSRNDGQEAYDAELIRAIRGIKRNVNLSRTQGASIVRKLAYEQFTDFTGKKWNSYKDFLIGTGAVMTNMTKVVDHTGNNTLSYTNPKGVRPQSIVIGSKKETATNNKAKSLAFSSTGSVSEFAKLNGLSPKYNFAYDIADALGIIMTTGVQSDPVTFAMYNKNKITVYEKFVNESDLNKSLLLSHEIIHGIINNTIGKTEYQPFVSDIKKFYDSIRDLAIKSNDKVVKQIIDYIDSKIASDKLNEAMEEVVTYGLTNLEFAKFLQNTVVEQPAGKITYQKSAWSEFKRVVLDLIKAVADELGVKTKMDELVEILESYNNLNLNANSQVNPINPNKPNPFEGRNINNNSNPFDDAKLATISGSEINLKADITSDLGNDMFIASGFTPAEEYHAYRDIIVTKFLKTAFNKNVAETTIAEIKADRTKSAKMLVGDSILKQAIDDYNNDRITYEQAVFINKIIDDLNKVDSILWDKAKDYIANNYGINIIGEEDFLADFNFEIPETWDDRQQFKIPSDETINHLVKTIIHVTPVVDPSKTTINNGELVYISNKTTPSGYPEMLDFQAVYPYLREHMTGLLDSKSMIDKVFELGSLHDKSLWVLWDVLSKDQNLANAWYSSFNFQIPERHVLLLSNEDGLTNIKTDIGNRSAFRIYALSNEWIENIRLNLENDFYDADFWTEFYAKKEQVVDMNNRIRVFGDDTYKGLSELFNMLGIDLTEKELKYFIEDENNLLKYNNENMLKKQIDPRTQFISNYLLPRIEYIEKYIVMNDDEAEFNEYSRMIELARMTLKFRYYKGNMSSMNVKNNLVHAPIKPNFLSEWFKLKDAEVNGTDPENKFFSLLQQHNNVPKMRYSNLLWNTSQNLDKPNGFLTSETVMFPSTNYLRKFRYRLDEGRKHTNSDRGEEYTDIKDNLNKLVTYIGEKKDGMTLFELFNSDSGHTYYISGNVFTFKGENGYINRESEIWKAMYNTVMQEVVDVISNFDLVFATDVDIDGHRVYIYDEDGNPFIKEEVANNLIVNKHTNKKGEIFDKNGKPIGRAFSFTGSSFERKIGHKIETVNIGSYLEKVKNKKVFDSKGMLIPDVLHSYKDAIQDYVDELIDDIVQKNIETNQNHSEFFEKNNINGKPALSSYENFNHFIAEYALNSYINNVEYKNFFGANTNEIADSLDYSKRANQITRTKHSYSYESSPSRPNGLYNSISMPSVYLEGTIYKSLMDEFNDAKFAKHFKSINTTDGFSLITLDEFEERTKRNGTYKDYKDLIDYLRDPNVQLSELNTKKLQSLKHFYYGYDYNPILNSFVSEQVKNSEMILVPRFVKGTNMEQIHKFMVDNNIHQLDFNDSVKMGDIAVSYPIIEEEIDSDGNLNLTEAVKNALLKTKKERSYKNLGVQQTVVDHIEDEEIKLGVQISKLVTNNLNPIKNYFIGDKTIKGKDLISFYHQVWNSKIERAFNELMNELDIEDIPSIENVANIISNQFETNGYDIDVPIIISTVIGMVSDKVKKDKIYDILKTELRKRTNNINSITGATLNPETKEPFMPVYWSSSNKQNMNILASLFTNNVGTLKLPGIHATLASGVFYSNTNKITKKNEQGNFTFKEGEIQYVDKVAQRKDKRLRFETLSNGNVIKAEVLLPAWSSKFFEEGQLININDIPEEIRTMIGYRIPTEAKRSMFIFEVVGFLPKHLGSTVIVPDDFIAVSGSDFDIDSLYIFRRHFETEYVKAERNYGTKEFVDFANKFIMSYAPIWAGEYIKYDRKEVLRKYINSVINNPDKIALLDRINKARYTVREEEQNPETLALYDDVTNNYDQETEYIYDDETGVYLPSASDMLLPVNKQYDSVETLNDIDSTDFVNLSIVKATLTAFNAEFKKKNKGKNIFKDITINDNQSDEELYNNYVKDFLKSRYGKRSVDSILEKMKENSLKDTANFLLTELGYNSRIKEDLTKDQYKELISSLLQASNKKNISSLLLNKNSKGLINLLIENNKLKSFADFTNQKGISKFSDKQIDNLIFDVYKGILSNPVHYKEKMNAIEAKFTDVQDARNMIEQLTGIKSHKLNSNRPEDLETLKQINLAVRDLKGVSVGIDGFLSIAQATNMTLAINIAPVIKYENVDSSKFNQLKDLYKDDLLNYDEVNQTAIVRHRYILNNPKGNGLNADGDQITSISSQASANILDAVKFFLPSNVNEFTLSLWKMLVAVGVGNKWKYATSFINQPAIVEISKLHTNTHTITYTGDLLGKEIEHIKRKYQTELYDILKSNFFSTNKTGPTADKLRNLFKRIDLMRERDAHKFVNIKREDIELLFGFNPNDVEAFSLETLNKMIEAHHTDKPTTDKGKVALLTGQLKVIETYLIWRKAAEAITDGVTTFNTDKLSANDENTVDLLTKIIKIDEYDDGSARLFINDQTAAKAIYPVFFGLENDSAYPPLQHYLYYSHLIAQSVIGQFDVRKTGKFLTMLHKFDSRVRNRISNYVLAHSVKELEFFNYNNRDLVLGINNPLNLKLIININKNFDKFDKLSFANKAYLLKKKYENGKVYKGQTFSLFDYLDIKITKSFVEKNHHQKVNFLYDGRDLNPFIYEVYKMYNSDDPFLKSFADDLIRYSYFTDGFTYGFRSLSKIIPVTALYQTIDEGGIGYTEMLEYKTNLMKTPEFDEVITDEIVDNIYRANWNNTRIVPIARTRQYWREVKDGSAAAKMGEKSRKVIDTKYPIYSPESNGIIIIPFANWKRENDNIKYSPFIRVRSESRPKVIHTFEEDFDTILKDEKTQITMPKTQDLKVGDIVNIGNQGLHTYKNVLYQYKKGTWYKYIAATNAFIEVLDKAELRQLTTEFPNPILYIPIEITSIQEGTGQEIFDDIAYKLATDNYFEREGYKDRRDELVRKFAKAKMNSFDTVQIIQFKKKGNESKKLKNNVGSDTLYQRYITSEESNELFESGNVYYYPVNKLLPYESSERSIVEDFNAPKTREEYLAMIMSIENQELSNIKEKTKNIEDNFNFIEDYGYKNIKLLEGETAIAINNYVIIRKKESNSDNKREIIENNIQQTDATILITLNPSTADNTFIKNKAGDKYIEIVLNKNVDFNTIVEKLNSLNAESLFITGDSAGVLGTNGKISEVTIQNYVLNLLRTVKTNSNIQNPIRAILTTGNTGVAEASNHIAASMGIESIMRMDHNFSAQSYYKNTGIQGINSLNRFDNNEGMKAVISSEMNPESTPDFLVNDTPVNLYVSSAERLKNAATIAVNTYNNLKIRQKYIIGNKDLNQAVESLSELDFDDIYHNLSVTQISKALTNIYSYHLFTSVAINNMLSSYDIDVDFSTLLDEDFRKTEFMNKMRYANAFIKGYDELRGLEYMLDGFDILDEQIKKIKDMDSYMSSLKSKYNRIIKRYYEYELDKYTTNPEIKAGIRELFDPQRDMNWAELYLDSLGDTENSFLANLYKKYATVMFDAKNEYDYQIRLFNKFYKEFAGNDPKEIVIKRFIDKYIAKDKDGNPTGYLVSKIDLAKWKEAYNKYREELETVKKKARSRAEIYAVHKKWQSILFERQTHDENGKTPEEAIQEKKAKLTKKQYLQWEKENIEYDSASGKFYFKSQKSEKFIDPRYEAIKDDPFYKYLSSTIASYMSEYHTHDFNSKLKKGAIPAMMVQEEQSAWDKLKLKAGWYNKKNRSYLGENDEILRSIPINFVHSLMTDKPFVPPLKQLARESYESYEIRRLEQAEKITGIRFKNLNEIKEYNKKVREENDKNHGLAINYDIEEVMKSFLNSIINYKHKKGIESEMLLGKELLKTLPVLKKDQGKSVLNKLKTEIINKPTYATTTGQESNLLKRYEKFLEMVFYEDFELDEGLGQRLAHILQNYTSMNGMWLNFTGAVNNVAMGKAQSFMETVSGYFWNSKDARKAEQAFRKASVAYIASIGKDETDNFEAALLKKFAIHQFQDERVDAAESTKNFVHKHLLTTNAFYILHHMGEFYMQSTNFLSMMFSHRVIEGKIKSFVEFKEDMREKALLEVVDDKFRKAFISFMDDMKEDRLKNPEKYGSDYIRKFAKTLPSDMLKKYREALGRFEEKAKKEFENYPTLHDSYELFEGVAVLKDGTGLTDLEINLFLNKATHVIQKIHGIYNKQDAGMIQNKALGRLAMQFRKWMRPGWNKRFGSKFASEFWNEQRNEIDKGSYISLWQFLTEPITDAHKAEMNNEHYNTLRAVQNIVSGYMRFITNVRLHYGTLSDFEKANVKRALSEMLLITGTVLLGNLIAALRGDGDDDELYVVNLAMYMQDRLQTDLQAYVPISPGGGWFNESKKLLRSPFAGFSTLEDLSKLIMFTFAYPFQDEEERIYQNGIYHDRLKVGVALKRAIPIVKQGVKMQRLEDYVEYYKLWAPF